MTDYQLWPNGGRTWLAQGHDTGCFVYAVVNSIIAEGRPGPKEQNLEEAFDIAGCLHGSTINRPGVVEFFDAHLLPTEYPEEVLQRGGILNIWHPIFNGHSFYLDHECEDDAALRLINSWLGPPVALNVSQREVRPYVTNRCGPHWVRTGGPR